MKYLFSFLFILSSLTIHSQILNAESLRKVTDTSGFSGSASLDFSIKRDINDYLGLSNSIHLQYKMKKHLVLLKNDIELKNIEGNKFENAGITHLRYNYRFLPKIAWEIFGQAQYNKVSKINFRGLVGTGPRFKLTNSENYKIYLGTLIMYEQEELSDGVTPLQREIRGSGYLTLTLSPRDNIRFISTTYYQPLLRNFSDFRLSNQTSLLIDLIKNLALKTSYTFTFDEYPAEGIPNSQYSLTTGVFYSFN